jgi:hypothetical protein
LFWFGWSESFDLTECLDPLQRIDKWIFPDIFEEDPALIASIAVPLTYRQRGEGRVQLREAGKRLLNAGRDSKDRMPR